MLQINYKLKTHNSLNLIDRLQIIYDERIYFFLFLTSNLKEHCSKKFTRIVLNRR
jgi:hypothetical protein